MKRLIRKIKNTFNITVEEDELTEDALFDDMLEDNNEHPIVKCEQVYKDLDLHEFDPDKDTILIIDDNEGMVSFLEDDMEFLEEKGIVDLEEVNILGISGLHAAFTFEMLLEKYDCLNIKWAIIDITLGGSKMTPQGNLKYSGVDVFRMIHENNPEVVFFFYTGNSLNPYIHANKALMRQFKEITGEGIMDHVLFKTSMDMDDRRKYIAEVLFGKYI